MYGIEEVAPIIEELMGAGAGIGLLVNGATSIFGIVTYVLTALALYALADRRGIKHAWLSWVPVINCWIIGSLSDQYRYVVKDEVKNKRKTLLVLNIIMMVIVIALAVAVIAMIFSLISAGFGGASESAIMGMVMGPAIAVFVILFLYFPMVIATVVVHYIAMYDIYTSCVPQNNVLFLVLSILFPFAEAFFLFFSRNKDEGMPPRKQEPVYTQTQTTEYL